MAKYFVLITLAVTLILLQTTHSASFECTEEPAICKTKFATQFENGAMDFHLASIRKLITTFTEISNTVKSELPENSPLAKYMEKRLKAVNNALEKIHGNVGDIRIFTEAVEEGMDVISGDIKDVGNTEEFQKLVDKHDFTNALVSILRKLGTDTGNFWAEMYKSLREMDLKAYPEYAEVNVHMENLRGNGGRPGKGSDFSQAAEILGTEFSLPYFKEIKHIS